MIVDKFVLEPLDHLLAHLLPWQIVALSVTATCISIFLYKFLWQDDSLFHRGKKFGLRLARKIPAVRDKIAREFQSSKERIEHDMLKPLHKDIRPIRELPSSRSAKDVLDLAVKYKSAETKEWDKLSGTVYSGSDDLTKLVTEVYSRFAWSNPLHPDVFPAVRQMEAEVIRMTCTLFNGNSDSCGSMTSGGTESILMACKAYRDRAFSLGITKPFIVAPVTAHAAFDKAAEYLGIRIKHIPVDSVTCKLNIRAMERAISSRTCMLVASAPQFPHGIIDPVEEVSRLGLKYSIPVHVDCCLGGFLLPFMDKAGFPLLPFDFRLKGVTSISADTHKYAYSPKGSSVIMYRSDEYLHHQYAVAPDWPGGIYASPSLSGSRVGASIATTWAVILYMGQDGYLQATREIIETARRLEQGLRQVEHISILGQPEVSVISFCSNSFNIYRLSDAMGKRGWNLNALQFPSSVHICVTRNHTAPGVVERFLQDVRECVEEIVKNPGEKTSGMAAIYGMAQSVPDRSVVSEMAWAYLDTCTALPDHYLVE
ncbi:hypothetical protein RvY_08537 [Ramazzottius varieornatus]|uniref:Sphingosine-1-phosphate lyase 1 n=1 Tax=Ramazzottius varieornatus TaxID=947166 RepID=A0A1D1V661_RAMVA|nr:hypothetical protein RvY_08537 [Ramazzottius varieornatus]